MSFTSTEIAELRAQTPGTKNCAHLNNAGAALMPLPVFDNVQNHLKLELEIGGYEAANHEAARCDEVYDSIARLINAQRSEIALVENATVAWQMAFHALKFQPGDKIITARAEYAANYLSYLQKAKQCGVEIEVIPDDACGASDANAFAHMIDDRVKLIALTHIPTNGGLINPVAEIGAIAIKHNIPYLLDACQSAGQMPLDVEELGCDFLSVSGRKFMRGPRGTGFLYVRGKWLNGPQSIEPPFIDLFSANWISPQHYEVRADARRFENWENSYALRLGLGASADYAMEIGLERIQTRTFGLADALRHQLDQMPEVRVRDLGAERCAIVSFSHDKIDAADIKRAAAEKNINISVSKPGSTRLDAEARGLRDLVRVSPHYYNTEEEIARFMAVVKEL